MDAESLNLLPVSSLLPSAKIFNLSHPISKLLRVDPSQSASLAVPSSSVPAEPLCWQSTGISTLQGRLFPPCPKWILSLTWHSQAALKKILSNFLPNGIEGTGDTDRSMPCSRTTCQGNPDTSMLPGLHCIWCTLHPCTPPETRYLATTQAFVLSVHKENHFATCAS